MATITELQQRIHACQQADHSDDPQGAAAELARLEQELYGRHSDSPEEAVSETRADARILLSELEGWARLAGVHGLDTIVEAAGETTRSHLARMAVLWRDAVRHIAEQGDPRACFDALLITTRRQLELKRRCPEGCSPGHAALKESREELRAALLASVREQPPGEALRKEWATALVDRGDMILTAVDGLPPAGAASTLKLVADDLQWHLQEVERRFGVHRRRLSRKLRRLNAERQERRLQGRLEEKFGAKFVARGERLVLVLIVLVLVLMTLEYTLKLSPMVVWWFNLIDAGCCAVFLLEFFLKLSLVPGRLFWFRRHVLIDLIPAIPIGLIATGLESAAGVDAVRAGRLSRFLRLPRLARYVRIVRPVVRIVRGFGLLARGLDRLARQYGHILNQNVILYPTRQELQRSEQLLDARRSALGELRNEISECWSDLLTLSPAEHQLAIAECRMAVFRRELEELEPAFETAEAAAADDVREIPAGVLIEQLASSTPQSLEATLGTPLIAQLSRMLRVLGRPPMRWLPLIGSVVPRITPDMTDAEAATAASRRLGAVLQRYHNMWFWVADLYGTVTPSQFVDRVGTTLVNSSFRPAYRLALFGGVFLLTDLVLRLTHYRALEPIKKLLNNYIGPTVLLMGGTCFVILLCGIWLKRMAREATEFFERSAEAQFLALTEIIRSRYLDRDAEILYDRVLRPEWEMIDPQSAANRQAHVANFLERVRDSLLESYVHVSGELAFEGLDRTVLLYRDWLDGALLTDTDTRTTSQLLGNPAIRQMLLLSSRVKPPQIRALAGLDLVRQKSLFGGPYLWFNFISRSIVHSVASLLVDYNRKAIPLDELPQVSSRERERYEQWLAEAESPAASTAAAAEAASVTEQSYVTTAFTALHFLDDDPQRDHELEQRFGSQVLRRVQDDRSLLIRRIFGTYPMHDRPKEQRMVNLYALYGGWLAGGRAVLFPWFFLVLLLQLLAAFCVWIARSVREIRNPQLRRTNRDAARAHYRTAIRKIRRIRGPIVAACTRLRMQTDPEYLGVPLPGCEKSTLDGADAWVDCEFLEPGIEVLENVEEQRERAEADMQRLEELIEGGLLVRAAREASLPDDAFSTPQHLRAAAVAYQSDYRDVRTHLSADAIVRDVCRLAVAERMPPVVWRPAVRLRLAFRRYWREHGFGGRREQRAAWRAVARNRRGAADALMRRGASPQVASEEGTRILAAILLHPGRMTEQLLTLRAIHTLSILDVLNYREHVFRLGRYADMGDQPGKLLEWNTTPTADSRGARPAVDVGPLD